MTNYFRSASFLLVLSSLAALTGCKKSAFLNAKPDNAVFVPTTITDFQKVLDNDEVMNGYGQSGSPNLGETGADNYWIPLNYFTRYLTLYYQEACTWAPMMISGSNEVNDWDLPYRRVLYANEAITGLLPMHPTAAQQQAYQIALGGAYFFRGTSFYELAQIFAPAYDSLKADTAWGIPLRLTADPTEPIRRARMRETYQRITGDLRMAVSILPDVAPPYPTRPSKTAAYAMLARVYLSMGKYDSAYRYADTCLGRQSTLMRYDTCSGIFYRFNPEVIFAEVMQQISISPVTKYFSFADSTLYRSYSDSDLRKTLWFIDYGGAYFVGFYDEGGLPFCGLATDELYLIRAECEARAGDVAAAMKDLNTLLATRWASGTYTDLTAVDGPDALGKILVERRKELLYRGLRWTDLRRLYKDPWWPTTTLHRSIGTTIYQLPPGDPRYVYPIPDNVMGFNPTMPQNLRY